MSYEIAIKIKGRVVKTKEGFQHETYFEVNDKMVPLSLLRSRRIYKTASAADAALVAWVNLINEVFQEQVKESYEQRNKNQNMGGIND